MAALVLKNSVKNYVNEVVSNSLICQSLVEVLLSWLVAQEGVPQSKKLVQESVAILARVGFTEFEEFQLNQKQRDPSLHVKPVIETALDLLTSGSKPEVALRVLN